LNNTFLNNTFLNNTFLNNTSSSTHLLQHIFFNTSSSTHLLQHVFFNTSSTQKSVPILYIMMLSTATLVASLLASMVIANPAQLDARDDWGKVLSFKGDLCDGAKITVEVFGSGSKRCQAIGGRSLRDVQKR
jgi:hypothetical protein